ncbi:MAG: radical SAM protein [Gemmatimonadetes bacterium]|nr:radical SAM protein [Gemmatimonadota bacterium]
MLRIDRSDLHLFRTSEGKHAIVFQVDSGLFFELVGLAETILKEGDGLSVDEVVSELGDEYDRFDVLNTIEDLAEAGLVSDTSLKLLPANAPFDERPCESPGLTTFADPFHITLHVAHACNIKCAYCFAHGGDYGGQPGFMQPDVAQQAIRWALDSAVPFRKCQIDFFGGEPLLNFELIRKVVPFAREYAHKIGVDVSFGITTNGSLMTEEINQFLIDEKIHVKVSVDGNAPVQNRLRKFHDGSDTYDVVAENVRKLAERSSENLAVHATMTSFNMDSEAIGRDLEKLGAAHVELAPVVASPKVPYAFREEHLPELKRGLRKKSQQELKAILSGTVDRGFFDEYIARLMRRAKACHGCGGGKTFFAVSVDGSIYFCSSLADSPEFKMGDVFTGLDVQMQDRINETSQVDNRTDCRTCWARNLCGGGCLFDAQTATGDPMKPNPVSCEQIRYRYELAMEMGLEIQKRDETILLDRYNLEWIEQVE